MNKVMNIKKSMLIGSIIALSGCSQIDHSTQYTPLNNWVKSNTLEQAKKSETLTHKGETLLKVCADLNRDIDSDLTNWYCQESVILSNGNVKYASTISHHYVEGLELSADKKTTTIKTSMVEDGLRISANNDTLNFDFTVLMAIERKEIEIGFVESPVVANCEGKVSYSAPSANGFIFENCYYEYSKHI
ncbi:hypothetical protein [Moritella sp. F3]|uniref:hypothetical protein n=1 Tax=Moritella sp. F3 TaxID=2718882 RepID=UPI0018E0C75A|nr:hypothetical protein [Moritella sp. F3]GIC77674.1 hypothetical protein FMO001_24010 [Moritella sp. F1]GIC82087.1 hypothetical protein FMO003_23680 [Moritella sp. F3]